MATDEDVLATVSAARERTRLARRAGWIPLAMFGLLVLPAVLFHLQSRTTPTTFESGATRLDAQSYANVDGGAGLFWYWQFAIPLGYALVAGLFALRNHRAGVRSAVGTYLAVGVVLTVAVFFLASSAAPLGLSNFGLHGMEATVTIGLALFVLARLERSVALAVCAGLVTAVAVAASQYDIENLWGTLHAPAWLDAVGNDLALSTVLLLCAGAVFVFDRSRARRAGTA